MPRQPLSVAVAAAAEILPLACGTLHWRATRASDPNCALLARALHLDVKLDLFTIAQGTETRSFDARIVDEVVLALRVDKSESSLGIEELYGPAALPEGPPC